MGGLLGEKNQGNPLGWLGSWLGDLGKPLKPQAQPALLEARARFTLTFTKDASGGIFGDSYNTHSTLISHVLEAVRAHDHDQERC